MGFTNTTEKEISDAIDELKKRVMLAYKKKSFWVGSVDEELYYLKENLRKIWVSKVSIVYLGKGKYAIDSTERKR